MKSIISETLISKKKNTTHHTNNVTIGDHDFGYQIVNFDTTVFYIDFWLFDHVIDRTNNNNSNNNNNIGSKNEQQVQCVGRKQNHIIKIKGRPLVQHIKGGCYEWYKTFHAKSPPIFTRSDYFPPIYEIFGTHYVPIPHTSKELETFQYSAIQSMGNEHWNGTCGPHRRWTTKKSLGLGTSTVEGWVKIPLELRSCEILYADVYPFVFKKENDEEIEELRQGDVVIHRTRLLESLA